jgi:hypothetical protein
MMRLKPEEPPSETSETARAKVKICTTCEVTCKGKVQKAATQWVNAQQL